MRCCNAVGDVATWPQCCNGLGRVATLCGAATGCDGVHHIASIIVPGTLVKPSPPVSAAKEPGAPKSVTCVHGRQKSRCKECGGISVCEHGRRKSRCKDCGGSEICAHGKERSKCHACKGGSICIHGRRRSVGPQWLHAACHLSQRFRGILYNIRHVPWCMLHAGDVAVEFKHDARSTAHVAKAALYASIAGAGLTASSVAATRFAGTAVGALGARRAAARRSAHTIGSRASAKTAVGAPARALPNAPAKQRTKAEAAPRCSWRFRLTERPSMIPG